MGSGINIPIKIIYYFIFKNVLMVVLPLTSSLCKGIMRTFLKEEETWERGNDKRQFINEKKKMCTRTWSKQN